MKNYPRWNTFFKFRLTKIKPCNWYLKTPSKWFVKERRSLSEEKKPTRAQIFRYFRYESRNNKTERTGAKRWMLRIPFKFYGAVMT